MARTFRNKGMQNLRRAGGEAARFTAKTTGKTAVGLFHWATTDHYGTGEALDYMSQLGFLDGIKYFLIHILIVILGAVLSAVWITALIVFGIPFLITGHF